MKWEYTALELRDDDFWYESEEDEPEAPSTELKFVLNDFAENGWEVVSGDSKLIILKRPKQ